HIAHINPFRYRGYYFDVETGLYYLGSRYYDPETGRFINSDGILCEAGNVKGNNMFVFVFNNPINMTDEDGLWPSWSNVKVFAQNIKNGFVDTFVNQYNSVKNFLEHPLQTYKEFYTNPANIIKLFPVVDLWVNTVKGAVSGIKTLASGDPSAIGYRTGQNLAIATETVALIGVSAGASKVMAEIGTINTVKNIHPPGWNANWRWMYGTRMKSTRARWFDLEGGEWRYHFDKDHPIAHWDYNPWVDYNTEWQNLPLGGK
ncbi:MAG: RHS repeat-associated core domain-containing protein, partial [Peptococcaceae bacterium]|nr:RHS repeat-associated core domain-containing protein [Peptococcaceae bacterium]